MKIEHNLDGRWDCYVITPFDSVEAGGINVGKRVNADTLTPGMKEVKVTFFGLWKAKEINLQMSKQLLSGIQKAIDIGNRLEKGKTIKI